MHSKVGSKTIGERREVSPLPRYSGGEGSGVRGRSPRKTQDFARDAVPPSPDPPPGVPGGEGGSALLDEASCVASDNPKIREKRSRGTRFGEVTVRSAREKEQRGRQARQSSEHVMRKESRHAGPVTAAYEAW